MTTIKHRIAQQWPRVTVGLYALWGLYGGIAAIWFGLHFGDAPQNPWLLNSTDETELDPSEPERIFRKSILIFGSFIVLINIIKLYAPVRKSIAATRLSLVFWAVEFVILLFGVSSLLLIHLGKLDKDDNGEEEELLKPSAGDWARTFRILAMSVFSGWALLVFLRDLHHQQRNAWGRLVRTGGVHEYDPVGLVQI